MAAKTYWSILETFANGSKIPLNLFNVFFSKQCCAVVNNNSLTINITFETENRLSTFGFSLGDIIKFMKALDLSNRLMDYISTGLHCLFIIKTFA